MLSNRREEHTLKTERLRIVRFRVGYLLVLTSIIQFEITYTTNAVIMLLSCNLVTSLLLATVFCCARDGNAVTTRDKLAPLSSHSVGAGLNLL